MVHLYLPVREKVQFLYQQGYPIVALINPFQSAKMHPFSDQILYEPVLSQPIPELFQLSSHQSADLSLPEANNTIHVG